MFHNKTMKQTFQFGTLLGQGKLSKTYLVRHIHTRSIFALKIITKTSIKALPLNQQEEYFSSIKVLMFLSHPNLIKIYGVFSDSEHVYILIELCSERELGKYLMAYNKFQEKLMSELIEQVLVGVKQIRDIGMEPTKISLKNIIISLTTLKISKIEETVRPKSRIFICGSSLYLSPDNPVDISKNAFDIKCIGRLVCELLTGKNCKIKDQEQLAQFIGENQMILWSESLKNFLFLVFSDEITALEQLLKHQFITEHAGQDRNHSKLPPTDQTKKPQQKLVTETKTPQTQ